MTPSEYRKAYYTLNLTWGLLMNIVGAIAALGLLLIGKRPSKYAGCWHFEIGRNWGGLSLGMVIITCKGAPGRTKRHELGHSIQNAIYGPGMIFLTIASALRYWYRIFMTSRGYGEKIGKYDDFWLEAEATKFGNRDIYMFGK